MEDYRPTLVIGDIHGHLDRLEALLKQEGLIDRCQTCGGFGEVFFPDPNEAPEYESGPQAKSEECLICGGWGITRVDEGRCEVVLVGDVGHFGMEGQTADALTWKVADHWADVILWGNHDRAVIDGTHRFTGYWEPQAETKHLMTMLRHEKTLKLAHAAHGFLITHAGLHLAFKDQKTAIGFDKNDPNEVTAWLNVNDELWFEDNPNIEFDPEAIAVRDAVGHTRGGRSPYGGILWRDVTEKLYTWSPEHPERFRQIFGHSADHKEHKVRYCGEQRFTRKLADGEENPSYCIDVGGKGDKPGDNCLAGLWIDGTGEWIVRVDLDR